MSFNSVPLLATGDWIDAAWGNTYWKDNMAALWPYTTAGDLAYAASSTTLNRLALGSSYKFLQTGASAPAWGGLHFCAVYHNTTQNVGNASATALVFNDEISDVQGWHSASVNTSRITVPETGHYQAACYFNYGGAGGAGTYFDTIEMRINGSVGWAARHWVEVNGFSKYYGSSTPIFALTAGQYVEWFLEQNSGGTRTISTYANASLWRVG